MPTFVFNANYLPEEVDGKQYISVFCFVKKGDVCFSRTESSRTSFVRRREKAPREDESGKRLLEQIREINVRYQLAHRESIDADILMDKVIVIRFQEDETYSQNIVTHIYDIVHGYCLIEEALRSTRALETLDELFGQVKSLLFQLKVTKKSEESASRIQYLVTSVRYGSLDVFGGVIPQAPKNHKRETLLEWLKPIRKRINKEKKPQQ
jgi:hypothetical protein